MASALSVSRVRPAVATASRRKFSIMSAQRDPQNRPRVADLERLDF